MPNIRTGVATGVWVHSITQNTECNETDAPSTPADPRERVLLSVREDESGVDVATVIHVPTQQIERYARDPTGTGQLVVNGTTYRLASVSTIAGMPVPHGCAAT